MCWMKAFPEVRSSLVRASALRGVRVLATRALPLSVAWAPDGSDSGSAAKAECCGSASGSLVRAPADGAGTAAPAPGEEAASASDLCVSAVGSGARTASWASGLASGPASGSGGFALEGAAEAATGGDGGGGGAGANARVLDGLLLRLLAARGADACGAAPALAAGEVAEVAEEVTGKGAGVGVDVDVGVDTAAVEKGGGVLEAEGGRVLSV